MSDLDSARRVALQELKFLRAERVKYLDRVFAGGPPTTFNEDQECQYLRSKIEKHYWPRIGYAEKHLAELMVAEQRDGYILMKPLEMLVSMYVNLAMDEFRG